MRIDLLAFRARRSMIFPRQSANFNTGKHVFEKPCGLWMEIELSEPAERAALADYLLTRTLIENDCAGALPYSQGRR